MLMEQPVLHVQRMEAMLSIVLLTAQPCKVRNTSTLGTARMMRTEAGFEASCLMMPDDATPCECHGMF